MRVERKLQRHRSRVLHTSLERLKRVESRRLGIEVGTGRDLNDGAKDGKAEQYEDEQESDGSDDAAAHDALKNDKEKEKRHVERRALMRAHQLLEQEAVARAERKERRLARKREREAAHTEENAVRNEREESDNATTARSDGQGATGERSARHGTSGDDYESCSVDDLLQRVELDDDALRAMPWRQRNRYEKQRRSWRNKANPYRKSVMISVLRERDAAREHDAVMQDVKDKRVRARERKTTKNRMLFAKSGKRDSRGRCTGQSSMTLRIQRLNEQLATPASP